MLVQVKKNTEQVAAYSGDQREDFVTDLNINWDLHV